jgi:hypothetical protein
MLVLLFDCSCVKLYSRLLNVWGLGLGLVHLTAAAICHVLIRGRMPHANSVVAWPSVTWPCVAYQWVDVIIVMATNITWQRHYVALYVGVAEPDPTRETRPIRPDLNPIRSDLKKKSNWSDPIRPDPTRDQMTFNSIEIYQRCEKTQHINWSDSDPDPTRFLLEGQTDPTRPTRIRTRPDPTRPIATSICMAHDFGSALGAQPQISTWHDARHVSFMKLYQFINITGDNYIWPKVCLWEKMVLEKLDWYLTVPTICKIIILKI